MEEQKYVRKKSSGIATLLSFFWCGLGQIYNGQIFKGIILMFLSAISWVLATWLWLFTALGLGPRLAGEKLEPGTLFTPATLTTTGIVGIVFGLAGFVLWIYGMVNAHKTAERINRGEI